jgi:hypothetical protein
MNTIKHHEKQFAKKKRKRNYGGENRDGGNFSNEEKKFTHKNSSGKN